MNFRPIRPFAAAAPLDWKALVQWLFVVLVVFDLVSSPFHQHHHDGGVDSYSTHADQHDQNRMAVSDVDEDDHDSNAEAGAELKAHGGHSLSAIRGISAEVGPSTSSMEPQFLGPLFVFVSLLTLPVAQALVPWRLDRSRPPIPLFRTVPPDGRAPPVFST
ncbi:hypothetical protein ACSFA3_21550 [Variovorax sp. RHLX14]|uniref:hypothetical protein n=1 Tax=Variovorax sp. RHLX14 TaxID=1259731 RepID=UPI003F48D59D